MSLTVFTSGVGTRVRGDLTVHPYSGNLVFSREAAQKLGFDQFDKDGEPEFYLNIVTDPEKPGEGVAYICPHAETGFKVSKDFKNTSLRYTDLLVTAFGIGTQEVEIYEQDKNGLTVKDKNGEPVVKDYEERYRSFVLEIADQNEENLVESQNADGETIVFDGYALSLEKTLDAAGDRVRTQKLGRKEETTKAPEEKATV